MSISLNVLGMPTPDIPALLAWVAQAKPPLLLVMDEIDIGRRVQMVSPRTEIVFRRYRPDDHELSAKLKPADFLASITDVPANWIVQAGNEPGGDQALLTTWTAALIRQATAIGRRLAVGNWSVGNPDTDAVADGKYDLILQALAGGGRHYLGTHEYFFDKPIEEVYFVGRYKAFLRRAGVLGIQRPAIAVLEHGRDLGGGHDGWRAQGWTEAQYADRLEAAQTVYAADNVCACVFSYGPGFSDRWQTYNVEGANTLLDRMAAMNDRTDEVDDMAGPPGWAQVTTNGAGYNVNVRQAPSLTAQPVATVKTGDWVRPQGAPVAANGHSWQRVVLENCIAGYVSLNVLKLGKTT